MSNQANTFDVTTASSLDLLTIAFMMSNKTQSLADKVKEERGSLAEYIALACIRAGSVAEAQEVKTAFYKAIRDNVDGIAPKCGAKYKKATKQWTIGGYARNIVSIYFGDKLEGAKGLGIDMGEDNGTTDGVRAYREVREEVQEARAAIAEEKRIAAMSEQEKLAVILLDKIDGLFDTVNEFDPDQDADTTEILLKLTSLVGNVGDTLAEWVTANPVAEEVEEEVEVAEVLEEAATAPKKGRNKKAA